jgi:serine/threonine protein kinase
MKLLVFLFTYKRQTHFSSQQSLKGLFDQITNATFSFPAEEWSVISSDAKDFISALLVVDPKVRLTATNALRHPWMKQMTNQNAANLKIEMALVNTMKTDKQTKETMEGTEKKNPQSGLAHQFTRRTYTTPHWCQFCSKFLWGFVCLFVLFCFVLFYFIFSLYFLIFFFSFLFLLLLIFFNL